MKRIIILGIMISVALIMTSCKKSTDGELGPVDFSKTEASKAAALLKEATNQFNSGDETGAAQKALVAQRVLETIMGQDREVVISADCPIEYIRGDESMIQFAVSCVRKCDPCKLIRTTLSKLSSVDSSTSFLSKGATPALFTSRFRCPKCSRISVSIFRRISF